MELISVLLIVWFYFFPGIVALMRGHRNGAAIVVTNLLLGWTVLGWVAALVWASTDNIRERTA